MKNEFRLYLYKKNQKCPKCSTNSVRFDYDYMGFQEYETWWCIVCNWNVKDKTCYHVRNAVEDSENNSYSISYSETDYDQPIENQQYADFKKETKK